MSKKRYGDLRLGNMSREQLLDYAKRITRDHGRAQESINRLKARVEELEAQTGTAPESAPVHRTSAHHSAPHQCGQGHHLAGLSSFYLRKADGAGNG